MTLRKEPGAAGRRPFTTARKMQRGTPFYSLDCNLHYVAVSSVGSSRVNVRRMTCYYRSPASYHACIGATVLLLRGLEYRYFYDRREGLSKPGWPQMHAHLVDANYRRVRRTLPLRFIRLFIDFSFRVL